MFFSSPKSEILRVFFLSPFFLVVFDFARKKGKDKRNRGKVRRNVIMSRECGAAREKSWLDASSNHKSTGRQSISFSLSLILCFVSETREEIFVYFCVFWMVSLTPGQEPFALTRRWWYVWGESDEEDIIITCQNVLHFSFFAPKSNFVRSILHQMIAQIKYLNSAADC